MLLVNFIVSSNLALKNILHFQIKHNNYTSCLTSSKNVTEQSLLIFLTLIWSISMLDPWEDLKNISKLLVWNIFIKKTSIKIYKISWIIIND